MGTVLIVIYFFYASPVTFECGQMRKVFLAMLCLAISCTTALGGEFYGTVKKGGKPIKEATKIEVKCALSVKSGDVAPQIGGNSGEGYAASI